MFALSPLPSRNRNDDMRPITFSPSKRDSVSIRFSDRPSAKNCCSGSSLALTNGSTAMERSPGFGCGAAAFTTVAWATCCTAGCPACIWPRKNHPSAMATSTTAIVSMRLLPDALTSSFTPSGVSSSAQAISTAIGKPRANSKMTSRKVQTGKSNAGRMVAVTCSSQATAR